MAEEKSRHVCRLRSVSGIKGDVEEQESGERRGGCCLSGCVGCTRLQRMARFGDRDPQGFLAALRSKPKALMTLF